MLDPDLSSKQSLQHSNALQSLDKGEKQLCAHSQKNRAVKLALLTVTALLFFGSIIYLRNTEPVGALRASTLCQPCDAASACGVLVQDAVLPGNSLSALVLGSSRTALLPMDCRDQLCVPSFLPSAEGICESMGSLDSSEAEISQGRRENAHASRKLRMERQTLRSLRKRRRLQRIRSGKFTEYFQSRALGAGGDGGHGYLGINSHTSED